jgi:glyoxylase-like metal-dependent hydrolase (beta-lactamase superfamily II)
VIERSDIHPFLLGHFTFPDDGDPRAGEKVVVRAYLIDHPDGPVLLDTGIAEGHEETEQIYRPVRRSLDAGLGSAGFSVDDVRAVVNCHFHIDHCGNNPRFAGTPIFAQQTEFDAAHAEEDYPIPGLYDFDDARYELHGGEADVADGIRIVPTPGHTAGHQSLVVETRQGRVVLAGQAVNGATDFARAHFAQGLRDEGSDEEITVPTWIERVRELDPVEVLFAHDTASWHRDR